MNKYRCDDKECGFVQDFEPSKEAMLLHHPWMGGKESDVCPSCVSEINKGKRNNEPGRLKEE